MKITKVDLSNNDLKNIVKTIAFVVIPYFVLVITSFFFFLDVLKKLQILLYQKPGEVLYTSNGPVVGLVIVLVFGPFALYFLISKIFFPVYWRKSTDSIEISNKNIERVFIATVIAATAGLAMLFFNFKMYMVLGTDYVALSRAGIGMGDNREYYQYSDVNIQKYYDGRNTNYVYFIAGKKLITHFLDDQKLITDIQEHQKNAGDRIVYPRPAPSATNIRGIIGRFLTIFIMVFGISITLKMLRKKI